MQEVGVEMNLKAMDSRVFDAKPLYDRSCDVGPTSPKWPDPHPTTNHVPRDFVCLFIGDGEGHLPMEQVKSYS